MADTVRPLVKQNFGNQSARTDRIRRPALLTVMPATGGDKVMKEWQRNICRKRCHIAKH